MTAQQDFGGAWTHDKLVRLGDYLTAYKQAMKKQPFRLVYVDAFAGTGSLKSKPSQAERSEEELVEELVKGSARVALDVDPMFDEYLFIERSRKKCAELMQLKNDYPSHASRINVVKSDANEYLLEWCRTTNWRNTRAVVFLDSFGMQVEWRVLKALAETQGVDLWILAPLGMGANRLLTRGGMPNERWAARLTSFFGTEGWRDAFYREQVQTNLFGEEREIVKDASHDKLTNFFLDRLRTIFPGVAKNPLVLKNGRNSPMFLLCFAAANRRGAGIALKIAEHLLKE